MPDDAGRWGWMRYELRGRERWGGLPVVLVLCAVINTLLPNSAAVWERLVGVPALALVWASLWWRRCWLRARQEATAGRDGR